MAYSQLVDRSKGVETADSYILAFVKPVRGQIGDKHRGGDYFNTDLQCPCRTPLRVRLDTSFDGDRSEVLADSCAPAVVRFKSCVVLTIPYGSIFSVSYASRSIERASS